MGRHTIQTKNDRRGERRIWSNLGLNPSWMDARTFAGLKNLIWDQLLATKAEIRYLQLSCIFVLRARQEVIL